MELVRRWAWAFEHDPAVFVELVDPDITWAPFEENHTLFRGREGALQIRNGWLEAWAEHELEIEEIVDGGDDLVVSMHLTGRGAGSGVEADVRLHAHVRVRNGRVTYAYEHEEREAALRAAGLERR